MKTVVAVAAAVALVGCAETGAGGGSAADRLAELEGAIKPDLQKQLREEDKSARVSSVSCVEESDSKARCFARARYLDTTTRMAINVTYDKSGEGYIWEVDQ